MFIYKIIRIQADIAICGKKKYCIWYMHKFLFYSQWNFIRYFLYDVNACVEFGGGSTFSNLFVAYFSSIKVTIVLCVHSIQPNARKLAFENIVIYPKCLSCSTRPEIESRAPVSHALIKVDEEDVVTTQFCNER